MLPNRTRMARFRGWEALDEHRLFSPDQSDSHGTWALVPVFTGVHGVVVFWSCRLVACIGGFGISYLPCLYLSLVLSSLFLSYVGGYLVGVLRGRGGRAPILAITHFPPLSEDQTQACFPRGSVACSER